MITTPPPRVNMRYNDMVGWLTANGYSIAQVRRLVEKKLIKANHLRGGAKRAWYSAQQIKEALEEDK